MQPAKCRTCGAEILWLRTAATGALMPIDRVPVVDGNVAILDGKAHVIKGDLFEPMIEDGPRYKSHFATCPDAQKHRKKDK